MKTKEEIFEDLFARLPALVPCRGQIEAAYELLLACAEANGTVMVCGNGGSAADSEHIVGELMKSFRLTPFDPVSGKGFVRHLLTRYSRSTGQLMVCVCGTGAKRPC